MIHMQHTTNYNLNQWEAGDVVRREDFNADNAKIDAALKSVSDASPEIVFGTYTGDGNASQTINLGRKPRIVLVEVAYGIRSGSGAYGGLAAQGYPAKRNAVQMITLTDDGFIVYLYDPGGYGARTNDSGITYYYLAIF